MTSAVIKIAIVDPNFIYRAGIREIISDYKDLEANVEAENAEELIKCLKSVHVDIVLLNLDVPITSRNSLIKIKEKYPNVRVIMISPYNDEKIIYSMMSAGANGFLLKSAKAEIIRQTIKIVSEEEFCFDENTNKAMLAGVKNRYEDIYLSDKEVKLLQLTCEEKTTKEIADILERSPRTIEAMRDKIKTKTGTISMAGLVMFAVNSKLVITE